MPAVLQLLVDLTAASSAADSASLRAAADDVDVITSLQLTTVAELSH